MSDIGPNFDELRDWIRKNLPELWFGCVDESRVRLNELTGLDVKSTDLLEESAGRFLAALRKMKEESKC